MKCANNTELHEALAVLISGSTGKTKEALGAIAEYTRLVLPVRYTYEDRIASLKEATQQMVELYGYCCCDSCQNYPTCTKRGDSI
ncbi:MAG: hypothetical protein Ta2A_11520 [Treponemataceae bacterium]|nr:MAG: hypothetical protein Ta2A_11520 [Treponemataceae bacterium]